MNISVQILWSKRTRGVSIALLFVALFLGMTARANTFYVLSGKSMTWTTNGSKYVRISKLGAGAERVYGRLAGNSSSKFTLSQTYVSWPAIDSAGGDTTRTFAITFNSYVHDTNYAWLVLDDSAHADTVSLVGYGPNVIDSTDFNLYGGWIYYSVPDSVTSKFILHNHHTMPITVEATVTGDSGFTIDGVRQKSYYLAGSAQDTITIHYASHYAGYTTAWLTLISDSANHEELVTTLDARDRAWSFAVAVSGPSLGLVPDGDTVCGPVTIYNNNSEAITVTNFQHSSNYGWSWDNLPSLPLTIPANDSATFSICFAPGNFRYSGGMTGFDFSFAFEDSAGHTGTARGTAWAVTEQCIVGLRDSITLEDVIGGGYVEGTALFIMRKDSTLSAGTFQGWNCAVQILSPSLPMMVHAGDTIAIRFRVTPRTDSTGWFGGEIPLYCGGCYTTIAFQGSAVDSSATTLDLFPAQTGLLALRSKTSSITKTFTFDNNLASTILVTGVSLTQGTHFTITNVSPHTPPPPDTIAPSGSLAVTVQFDANTNGFYHDSLVIVTKDGATAAIFNLEAMRSNGFAADVRPVTVHASAELSVVPNPAEGPVTIKITNATRASIEIFDMLGSRIAAQTGPTSYSWSSDALPSGAYIVRASGTDVNGLPFVISKRLALDRH